MHWNSCALRLRPEIADDWVNPQRPKSDLMPLEFRVIVDHAIKGNRIGVAAEPGLSRWFEATHRQMASYRPDYDDPQGFENRLYSGRLPSFGGSSLRPTSPGSELESVSAASVPPFRSPAGSAGSSVSGCPRCWSGQAAEGNVGNYAARGVPQLSAPDGAWAGLCNRGRTTVQLGQPQDRQLRHFGAGPVKRQAEMLRVSEWPVGAETVRPS
jgi:hypothetical protein